MSREETIKLLNFYNGRNRLIIEILLLTGIRVGELASIHKSNLTENEIKLVCKGNKERTIYLPEETARKLKKYANSISKDKLFPNRRNIQRIVTIAMNKIGIEGSTHTLRHTSATMMYQRTHDILLVKEFLGHSTVLSTQIYTHINNDEIKRAVESNPLNFI